MKRKKKFIKILMSTRFTAFVCMLAVSADFAVGLMGSTSQPFFYLKTLVFTATFFTTFYAIDTFFYTIVKKMNITPEKYSDVIPTSWIERLERV